MHSLDRHLWRSWITNKTKLHLYRVLMLPTMLYESECWTITKADIQGIDAVDQWCLQRILDLCWNDFVRNDHTYSFEHSDNVFCVVERSNFIVASAVDDSHRLQADAFHSDLRRQQKPMIQVVEELVSGTDQMTIEVCGKL